MPSSEPESRSSFLAERQAKLEKIRQLKIHPFGERFERSASIGKLLENFQEGVDCRVAGRLIALRSHGKTCFGNLQDQFGKIQFYLKPDGWSDERQKSLADLLDLGDFVGVEGQTFKTRTGEPTIRVDRLIILAKALRPLPEKWHGLKDVETRYRQRYLDLVANPSVGQDFAVRSRMVSLIRRFLDDLGFLEVETPVMQPLAGGAIAKPFVTHHNALGVDLYLRVAPELYLKRLLVGGFEKVYELGKNFRNEGLSPRHNPEFTMLEVYQAYADMTDMMALTEGLIVDVCRNLLGSQTLTYQGHEIHFKRPFARLDFGREVADRAGVDVKLRGPGLRQAAKKAGLEMEPKWSDMDVIDGLFAQFIEPALIQPTFVTGYPAELSPLAKRNAQDPELAERFELFVSGQEIANAYSEQNDPQIQRECFVAQRLVNPVDSKQIDEDYLTALEHGMPPAGGLGIGMDRLAMILTDKHSIRDVILFPQMRPKDSE